MKTTTYSLLSLLLSLSRLAASVSMDCEHIRVDKQNFDISKLAGRHSISVLDSSSPPAEYNTTYTVNLCAPLEKLKGIKDGDQCPHGTRVCGVRQSWNTADDPDKKNVMVENVIPIAGTFESSTGASLKPKISRLKAQDSNSDGLSIELHGGNYAHMDQKAIIQLQCDRERTGNEQRRKKAKRDEKDDDDKSDDDKKDDDKKGDDKKGDDKKGDDKKGDDDEDKPSTSSLQFVSYGQEEGNEKVQVLRLNWRTKYACEDYADSPEAKKSGWGFFTWFLLIAFLIIAAYLIFGSWLNYNRYGARGWDLLPHGDTIRDIPYLFKDWSRKVVGTVAGGGSRGGYSAV